MVIKIPQNRGKKLTPDDVKDLTKRVKRVQGYMNRIERKARKYKRKQRRIHKKLRKFHSRARWLGRLELMGLVIVAVIQIIFIKNKIINKNI